MNRAMATWSGLAADAYAGAVTLLVDITYKMGGMCRAISQGLMVASDVVQAVRGFDEEPHLRAGRPAHQLGGAGRRDLRPRRQLGGAEGDAPHLDHRE